MMNFNPLFIDNNLSNAGISSLFLSGKALPADGNKNYLFADIIKVYEEELNVENSKLNNDLLVNLEGLKDFIVTKTDTKVIEGFQNSLNNLEEISLVSNSNSFNIDDAKISSKVFVLTPDNLLAFLGSINNIISETRNEQPPNPSGSILFYLNDFQNNHKGDVNSNCQLLDIKKLFSVMSNKDSIKFNFTTNGEKLTVTISQLNVDESAPEVNEKDESHSSEFTTEHDKLAHSQNLLLNIPGFNQLEKANSEYYKIEIIHIHKGEQKIFDIKTGEIRQPEIEDSKITPDKSDQIDEKGAKLYRSESNKEFSSDKIIGEIKPAVNDDQVPKLQEMENKGIDLTKINFEDLNTKLTKEEFSKLQEALTSKERKVDSSGKVNSKIITVDDNKNITEFNPPVIKKEILTNKKLLRDDKEELHLKESLHQKDKGNIKDNVGDNLKGNIKENIDDISVRKGNKLSDSVLVDVNKKVSDAISFEKITQTEKSEAAPQVKINSEVKTEKVVETNPTSSTNGETNYVGKPEMHLSKDDKENDQPKEQYVEAKETIVREQKETDKKHLLNDQFNKEFSKQQDSVFNKPETQAGKVISNDSHAKVEYGGYKTENMKEILKTIKASEIISEIVKNVDGSKQHLSFKLEPETLGKLTVSIDYVNNKLHANIEVENEQIKQFVQSNLEQLKSNLQNNGIQVSSLNVGLNNSEQKSTKHVNPKRKFYGKIAEIKTENPSEVKKMMGYNTYDFLV
ncbi:flagellar hook-length control protein FliK [Melioribacter sp. OK-6-Me]|uniref:flagellar hook-length control protein FliK n=1 Tax=unclassified Melioribacter TaxID=2627329 RepID=UPI003ED8DFC6